MSFNYGSELLEYFGEEKIKLQYKMILEMMMEFSNQYKTKKLEINITIFNNMIVKYFDSIKEIKSFHEVKNVSIQKSYAYMSYWILKYKPIQIKSVEVDEKLIFVNEKFVVTFIISKLLQGRNVEANNEKFKNFMDLMLYFFKYKDISVNTIEMMITAFEAGLSIQ
ncbi:MAG: hypothetical protein HDR15_02900 [Lachnospiraceae bacterium]|nr:hypothetical protein [Lachnospiraceae bacterium]